MLMQDMITAIATATATATATRTTTLQTTRGNIHIRSRIRIVTAQQVPTPILNNTHTFIRKARTTLTPTRMQDMLIASHNAVSLNLSTLYTHHHHHRSRIKAPKVTTVTAMTTCTAYICT